MKTKKEIIRIKTISDFHRLGQLPLPEHPPISVINVENVKYTAYEKPVNLIFDFYLIALKSTNGKIKYGQHTFDFDAGVMGFMAPNQVFSVELDEQQELRQSGWVLLIHPDFLWSTSLAKNIKQYDFFDYSVNEALFLSEKERIIINNIIRTIDQEYHANIDQFSKQIIITHLENLLSYANRFYHRQFLTRDKVNHQILDDLDQILQHYFDNEDSPSAGLPTVQQVSEKLNLSVSYLSRLLKLLTGQTTQQHIHAKIIEKAKEKLSHSELSVSEIAYGLGFDHTQTFSRLFKSKTSQSPSEFRQSLN